MGYPQQLIALSRRNTNIRSLQLALRQKPAVTAACDESLAALAEALAKEGFQRDALIQRVAKCRHSNKNSTIWAAIGPESHGRRIGTVRAGAPQRHWLQTIGEPGHDDRVRPLEVMPHGRRTAEPLRRIAPEGAQRDLFGLPRDARFDGPRRRRDTEQTCAGDDERVVVGSSDRPVKSS